MQIIESKFQLIIVNELVAVIQQQLYLHSN